MPTDYSLSIQIAPGVSIGPLPRTVFSMLFQPTYIISDSTWEEWTNILKEKL